MSDEQQQQAAEQGAVAEIEDDPRQVRLGKREALIAAGANPYGEAFQYTHHAADLEKLYADLENGAATEDEVRVAGRVMAIRDQGKIIFIVLRDSGADIQLFCRINALGDDEFAKMKDLDMGDWIGAQGLVMRTRRGQLSVAVTSFELLSKSIRPLPEKFHGLADKEIRYRQRYVDLIMNPDVRATFEKRFKIISAVRSYMDNDQNYYEVETPMLQAIMGGANARPFVTHHNALDRDFYLRIATELPLKRLLVGGFERVYEIGRVFRNEGMDQYHSPEFTTMEAYRAFSDLEGMMELVEGVFQSAALAACGTLQITYQGQDVDLAGPWPRRTMMDLASEGAGEEVGFDRSIEDLVAIAQRFHIKVEDQWGKGKLIAEIFEETCEAKLIQPIFVTDHPTEVSPLAKKKSDDENVTDRFELYICGHEYANAFSELNDPVDQAERFHAQVAAKDYDDEAMGYDDDYIRALEYGMPPAGGIGIGIDRMVMLLADAPSIRDVLLFPHMRDER
jgi:lysyl-tRNA synthetase class 2